MFSPKRSVPFAEAAKTLTEAEKKRLQKDRDDPVSVKRRLGTLEVLGYQFKRVSERRYRSKG